MNKLIRAGIMVMPIESIGLPSKANKSLLETHFQPINVKDICKSLIKHFSNCETAFYSVASRYRFNFFFFCLGEGEIRKLLSKRASIQIWIF